MKTREDEREAMRRIREIVSDARRDSDMTLADAARAAGVEPKQWSSFEYSLVMPPSPARLRVYIEAVGLDADEVMREVGLL